MTGEGHKRSEKNAPVERPEAKQKLHTEVKREAQDRAGWTVIMS